MKTSESAQSRSHTRARRSATERCNALVWALPEQLRGRRIAAPTGRNAQRVEPTIGNVANDGLYLALSIFLRKSSDIAIRSMFQRSIDDKSTDKRQSKTRG
ncbi:hypothetical protein [Burkholderia multivorans]|uniref:hypothetical protein n=1 Tax=Burkholderia multivorans TaxID=87883 RepID=UPI0013E07792|nr:hypothetical protein [Burkholderia multivorans]NGM78757.1 hypothetical protein [Burkholderia multivorans]